jgi:hypothetical protein
MKKYSLKITLILIFTSSFCFSQGDTIIDRSVLTIKEIPLDNLSYKSKRLVTDTIMNRTVLQVKEAHLDSLDVKFYSDRKWFLGKEKHVVDIMYKNILIQHVTVNSSKSFFETTLFRVLMIIVAEIGTGIIVKNYD